MRNVKRDAIVCTAVHLMLVAPFALAVILLTRRGENGIAGVDLGTQLFLMAAGVIMVAPIILYASCVKRVPMVIMGFLQYLSPTFGFICSRIMGEQIADGQMVIFGFIWALFYYIRQQLFCGNEGAENLNNRNKQKRKRGEKMKKEPVLVIMAAGMGSRFGGLKQIEPVSDKGEIIFRFSLYDA